MIEGAPKRVWRDWALVIVVSIAAVLETLLRTDAEWMSVGPAWRWASLVIFFVTVIPSLLLRRTRPLAACVLGFSVVIAFGVLVAQVEGEFGGLITNVVLLVNLYALYRWGSGHDGAVGFVMAIGAGIIGNITDPSNTVGDWIGGFIVLSIPIEVGLIVRYQRSAKARAISEAKSREREELARDLHDTVAHHVSAIAVQAQAGQALAATDPDRALDVLRVIEEAASRTLVEMRAMVGTLRNGAEADLAPQPGVSDLYRLANDTPGEMQVRVSIATDIGEVGAATQAALYRIARESITNAIRHARGATTVDVTVAASRDMVQLVVVDDGRSKSNSSGAELNGSGYGLLGMAERADMLGGTMRAGPRPDGGWQVLAALPRSTVGS